MVIVFHILCTLDIQGVYNMLEGCPPTNGKKGFKGVPRGHGQFWVGRSLASCGEICKEPPSGLPQTNSKLDYQQFCPQLLPNTFPQIVEAVWSGAISCASRFENKMHLSGAVSQKHAERTLPPNSRGKPGRATSSKRSRFVLPKWAIPRLRCQFEGDGHGIQLCTTTGRPSSNKSTISIKVQGSPQFTTLSVSGWQKQKKHPRMNLGRLRQLTNPKEG